MSTKTTLSFLESRHEQIKQLPGFQKHHRVPTVAGPSDQKFVADLAESTIDADLQETFSALRKSFGFKRKEISVDGPFEGTGIIVTPYFQYEIRVEIDSEYPSRAVFTRAVSNISEVGQVVAGPFDDVFGNRFSSLLVETDSALDLEVIVDTIEDADSELVKVDYDKDLTWCEIQVVDSPATVIVDSNSIQVKSIRETTPQQLLESFAEIQQQFISTLQMDDLSFAE